MIVQLHKGRVNLRGTKQCAFAFGLRDSERGTQQQQTPYQPCQS